MIARQRAPTRLIRTVKPEDVPIQMLSPQSTQPRSVTNPTSPQYEQAVQSNSSAAFARLLTRTLDPNQTVPAMRMPAWNLYLGERKLDLPQRDAVSSILTEVEMRYYSDVYLQKIQPCYGFLLLESLESAVTNAYHGHASSTDTALLCGIAALGCYFNLDLDWTKELQCVSLAKRSLEAAAAEGVSLPLATAALLRTIYLRLTAKPEEAWLSSCTTLHLIDAAGTCKNDLTRTQDVLQASRKLFDVATHLNIWSSFDLGRRRVILQNDNPLPPEPLPGHYTEELLGLLPYSRDLDPGNATPPETLMSALQEVIERSHSAAPSILAQCNLMLCIYRRLHAAKVSMPDQLVDGVIGLIGKSIRAVHSCMEDGLPWHHVASIPFQALCTLLAIDTAQSIRVLGSALSCLLAVNDTHGTVATKEAATAGAAIVELHRSWREKEVKKHSEMLQLYPGVPQVSPPESQDDVYPWMDAWWFNEFVASSSLDSNSLLNTLL